MSDDSHSVLPYRDAAERDAEVRRRRVKLAAGLGVAAVLVLAVFAAFVSYRRTVAAEYARLMAENQALRASLQQQQRAPQGAAAASSSTQSTPPPALSKGESEEDGGRGITAPPPKTVAKAPANGPDSGLSVLVRATAARIDERHAEAARLMAEAFAAEPSLTDDLESGHRYLAACSAALAAAGKGSDSADLMPAERAHLRKQALAWLQADLKARADAPPFKRDELLASLKTWIGDADLAGVRDPVSLRGLTADEQREWATLWADVAKQLGRIKSEGGDGTAVRN